MVCCASASFQPFAPSATIVAPPASSTSVTAGIEVSFRGTPATPSSTTTSLLSPSCDTSHSAPVLPALAQSVETV